jgi:hypothetical protein
LPTSNDVYATKYAAASLLAYTYWMQNNYTACIQYADEVINSNQFSLDPDVDIFNAVDSFQVDSYTKTPEGIFFAASYLPQSDARNDNFRNYIPGGTPAMFSMSQEFLQFMQLNSVDKRYSILTDYNSTQGQTHSLRFGTQVQNFPFFSVPILRLTILKLIRAESLAASGGDLSIARADLDALRQRAFPDGVNYHLDANLSATQVVSAAWEEFRKETFCEGLWIDVLRRRGAMGENIVIREAPWNCPGMAIQFPNSEGTGVGFIFNPERGCN